MLDNAPITLGDYVWIAPMVGLFATNHALDFEERKNGACQAKPIVIGNGVWLGGHVTVLGGVTIGDGAVIGAGAVVFRRTASPSAIPHVCCAKSRTRIAPDSWNASRHVTRRDFVCRPYRHKP